MGPLRQSLALLTHSHRPKVVLYAAGAPRSAWSCGRRLYSDKPVDPPVRAAPEEQLPSHREAQRWRVSKRLNSLLDDLMQRLAVASRHINEYTGTDYSGIEALRREIKEQEQLVRARYQAVHAAKHSLDASLDARTTAQKAVVALLERKSSWTAADLESYMGLIRSEHAHDQAVEASKVAVATAEQGLEEARARLEKRERAQYHEEQIWSDTIRRNSTWVTFGLMGVNILLLVVSIVGVEPWRRARLVREIEALVGQQQQRLEEGVVAAAAAAVVDPDTVAVGAAVVDSDTVPEPFVPLQCDEVPAAVTERFNPRDWQWVKSYARDPFGDQTIAIDKTQLTSLILQSTACGATIIGTAVYIYRLCR